MFVDDRKTAQMLAFLDSEHFRYKRRRDAQPELDEVDLSFGWSLRIPSSPGPLLSQMECDFRTFLKMCMEVDLARNGCFERAIDFNLTGSCRQGHDESFTLTVSEDRIDITAADERGLLHASHYLERQFSLSGAPYLRKGVTKRQPIFQPRISNTVFCMSGGSIDHPHMLTDRYMSLMSHFGINGVHLYIRLWDYCRNRTIPELNTDGYEENLAVLRDLCTRAQKYGIDIYLVIRNEYFPPDAPVFSKRPEVRGALMNYVTLGDRYCLCSSNQDVLACYEESLSTLFSDVPDLRGAVFLVGGEGFVHCFTRPKPAVVGKTSCPHCSGKDPSGEVAHLMNRVAASIHSVRPEAMVFTWPYSAFVWSGDEDFAQTRFIEHLNKDVLVLSNFETPGTFEFAGHSASLIDYNIIDLGPSDQFKAQSEALKKAGKAHYAKFESSTEPGWFFLPYIPVHYRWIDRINRMKEWNVPGYIAKWRFYGFTGSLPEEILAIMSWEDDEDIETILARIARRDFGDVSSKVLEGWRKLSDTWPRIPASHMIWGEREFYMRGPVYLGPAHPLIFNVQSRYSLGWKFFTSRGDLGEFMSESEIREMENSAPPRYVSDLLLTYPFGVESVEQGFQSALADWNAGVALLCEAFADNPSDRAQMEINVCRIIGVHLHTVVNVVRFYRMRDAFFGLPGTADSIGERVEALKEVLNDEIANAECALSILDSDIRIGYGHCNGMVYDADMVREKIQQCKYVRDEEIPDLESGILFHVYQRYQ